jgi:hypothetical protein
MEGDRDGYGSSEMVVQWQWAAAKAGGGGRQRRQLWLGEVLKFGKKLFKNEKGNEKEAAYLNQSTMVGSCIARGRQWQAHEWSTVAGSRWG